MRLMQWCFIAPTRSGTRSMTEPERGEATSDQDFPGRSNGIRFRNPPETLSAEESLVPVEFRARDDRGGGRTHQASASTRCGRVPGPRRPRGFRTSCWTDVTTSEHGSKARRKDTPDEPTRVTVDDEWRGSGGTNRV